MQSWKVMLDMVASTLNSTEYEKLVLLGMQIFKCLKLAVRNFVIRIIFFSCVSGYFSICRKTWRSTVWRNAPACNNVYEMKMVLQCILCAFTKLMNAETLQLVSRKAVGSLEVLLINALYSVQGWNGVNYRGRELLRVNWLEISIPVIGVDLWCDWRQVTFPYLSIWVDEF